MKYNILVMTPIKNIAGVYEVLQECGKIIYLEDPTITEVEKIIKGIDIIFTNPNKSKVFIGEDLIKKAKNLKIICTASTGTNHIDIKFAKNQKIKIISLTKEYDTIKKISSTAELAFALTLASLRNLYQGINSVLDNQWNYSNFIGRQMNFLKVGIIGYGRLGSIYASYCKAFGSQVYTYDPYKVVKNKGIKQIDSLDKLLNYSDVISLHLHVNEETQEIINARNLLHMKKDAILINTSRGELINEEDLVNFLSLNPLFKVASDVLSNEIRNKESSPLLAYAKLSNQVIITPHIGGMTKEAQEIAYGKVANNLLNYLREIEL